MSIQHARYARQNTIWKSRPKITPPKKFPKNPYYVIYTWHLTTLPPCAVFSALLFQRFWGFPHPIPSHLISSRPISSHALPVTSMVRLFGLPGLWCRFPREKKTQILHSIHPSIGLPVSGLRPPQYPVPSPRFPSHSPGPRVLYQSR